MTDLLKSSINPLLIHLCGIKTSIADAWENALEAYLESINLFNYYPHLTEAERILKYPLSIRKIFPEEPQFPVPPTAVAQKAYEFELRNWEKYDNSMRDARFQILSTLDESDKKRICAIDPINGMRSASIQIIASYVRTNYNVTTDSEVATLETKIRAPLDYARDLGTNLNDMKEANNILVKKGVGNSPVQLFRIAMEKLFQSERTSKLAYEYEAKPGTLNLQTFDELEKWIVGEYARRSKPTNSSAFAFIGDSDYAVRSTAFAVAGDDTATAAAATAGKMKSIPYEEYTKLMKLAASADKKTNQKLRIAKGYCILCGHGAHGANIGKICFKMSTNGIPNAGYTLNQVNCVTDAGGPVDSMVRSKAVMKGFKKE
jgi:hypothetical protein